MAPRPQRFILFIAFPGTGLLDLTGAQTVFWAATKFLLQRGLPGYELKTASVEGGLVTTAEGLALDTAPLDAFIRKRIDTIVVPGSPTIEQAVADNAPLVDWLRRHSKKARRIVSVCSGAFFLAQAGLLDGRRVATHWAMCHSMKAQFPAVNVDSDAIFVQHDSVWTSAGVTAGIDLAMALVEEDCGREIAMQVARELVVFLKRPGGQSQFSELLRSQTDESAGFDELHLWINNNLGKANLNVELLSEKVRMSPRNFARVYKQKTGRTPAKAVEIFRLEAAKRLLEQSDRNIDQIARSCGFGDEERMRVTFQRNLSIAPRDYRRRFSR